MTQFFHEVCRRTALLMVDWMRLGFVHGVMNTDNMSILGLTIDYGPYGWLEGYDPQWTPNTTDAHTRRYCYGNQPHIAQWNLARLAEALLPLVDGKGAARAGLDALRRDLQPRAGSARSRRSSASPRSTSPATSELVSDLFTLMARRRPTSRSSSATSPPLQLEALATGVLRASRRDGMDELDAALCRAGRRTARAHRAHERGQSEVRVPQLPGADSRSTPLEKGDTSVMERLMKVLERPYDEQPEHEDLAARRPEWARNRAGCSALSCSS